MISLTDTLPNQRALFDIPDDVAYLNCAYMSPLLKNVAAAGETAVRKKQRPWEAWKSVLRRMADAGTEMLPNYAKFLCSASVETGQPDLLTSN